MVADAMLDLSSKEDPASSKSSSSTGLIFLVASLAVLVAAFMFSGGTGTTQAEQEAAFAE